MKMDWVSPFTACWRGESGRYYRPFFATQTPALIQPFFKLDQLSLLGAFQGAGQFSLGWLRGEPQELPLAVRKM